MEKTYNPQNIEASWYAKWEQSGNFAPSGEGKPYCIMIPPPNVTGSLHMGHGFQHALMDALIRYHRMRGRDTLWQGGSDHAGIATQMVVEKKLAKEGVSRHDLGREAFVEKVWEWKQSSGNTIGKQLRRLGSSIDWERDRFTMDAGLSDAVSKVFIQLYEEDLIYRGKRLVNWDPTLLTAISDLEVISEEEDGHLWHIRYPLEDGSGHVVVATTRPETMLGDVAIAVHPEDENNKHLIGKMCLLPLTDRKIPIIADEMVDPEFGTGCVKITPAHDFNDNEVGKRHDLPLINILTKDAKLNTNAPEKYQGLDRFTARKQIIADLEADDLLEKTEKHRLKIPRGERSGDIVEPYLTDQWFVKTESLAAPALEVVKSGKIKFIPENWTNTYYRWMEDIQDWCISRQLWWGHRIPAWYDNSGNIYVAESEALAREKYNLAADVELTQDEDVLDTWFSSALWPFSTLGWPEQTTDLTKYYPTSTLVTGFDIIFFWVARMIMFGLKFAGDIPFYKVYITGLIKDHNGQKMSKSKGNVIDPIDLIDGIGLEDLVKKRTQNLLLPSMAASIEKATRKDFPAGIPASGTDALRFTFCAIASTGRDLRFDLSRLEGYRNFCNKIWNAARYVFMNTEEQGYTAEPQAMQFSLADEWIQSKLQHTIGKLHTHFTNYRFDLIAQEIYEFIWYEYCDWYLELSKPVLMGDSSAEAKAGTRYTLIHVLETMLRLLHPIMPFITEEIWQKVAPLAGKQGESIMLQAYPEVEDNLVNQAAESEIEWLKQVILAIRNIRGEMNIAPSKALDVYMQKGTELDQQRLEKNREFLQTLAKLANITWLNADETAPQSAAAVVGEMEVLIPVAGLIDLDAEKERLQKEIAKMQKEVEISTKKLSNPNFVDKAPEQVVIKEKARLQDAQNSKQMLEEKLAQFQ